MKTKVKRMYFGDAAEGTAISYWNRINGLSLKKNNSLAKTSGWDIAIGCYRYYADVTCYKK